ncbi:bifunctional DNA primase/polymerase [Streptomyces sp. MB09-01]|uniref:bifunctional DNA primase/polymerase n=1 Tax=Streptomyces sp. MB09-01 TaxID=3028666 RepID=UPI0029ACA3D4|nr:bifunctional DNA primase/polymerase [Streptomyces sp. MB09-01]MDX3537406.1 bifunctional DNA primase/polymerase [Streptomyces sp. MB09-01]
MTHTTDFPRDPGRPALPAHLRTALWLAELGLPVLPLRAGKLPFGNCTSCTSNKAAGPCRCGDRPNMKFAGPCQCPAPCHAWAAATTDPAVLTSPAWARAWQQAGAVAYHPGGGGFTVVDLDNADAVTWARQTLPATKIVPTTRGEHWIYRGAMQSANHARPGVDIKSLMAYAVWRGPGAGHITALPDAVRALVLKEETTRPLRGEVDSSSPTRARWDRSVATGCRHTDTFVQTGLTQGLARVAACREQGAGSAAYGVARFLANQHAACPGPCGLEMLGRQVIDAAVDVGVPEAYAERAVTRGLAAVAVRAS